MIRTMYFGHPINVYDTSLEKFLVRAIQLWFHDWEIENPNQPKHQEGYARWKAERGRGMDYYYQEVLPQCHGGVFLPFSDGKWGTGVWGEAKFLADRDLPLYTISHQGIISVAHLSEADCLTVPETRSRVYMPDGTMKPY